MVGFLCCLTHRSFRVLNFLLAFPCARYWPQVALQCINQSMNVCKGYIESTYMERAKKKVFVHFKCSVRVEKYKNQSIYHSWLPYQFCPVLTELRAMNAMMWMIWIQAIWHQDVRAGSDQHFVDCEQRRGSPCSSPDFTEINVTSEGSESRQQTAEAACQAAPQNILEREKYRVGTNNIPRHWAIRTALFLLTPPPAVTQSSMKSICCFVVLMIYLPLFWYSVMLFVGESLPGQWRLHTESKMPDVMNFNK